MAVAIVLVGLGAALVLWPASDRFDGRWELASADIEGADIAPGLPLLIDGNEIVGTATCNDFSGELGRDIFQTAMGCIRGDGKVDPPNLEERFMSAIRGTIERDGDTIVFSSSEATLTYTRVGGVDDPTNLG